jgi:glyoxylase-like metal-dependent hydrolase (beta-lactamase superfamily II)
MGAILVAVRLFAAAAPPFFKNGFLVSCETTGEAVVIDPGDEAPELVAAARQSGATVRAILLTHAHLDHVTGVDRVKSAFDVPVWLHRDDLFLYDGVVEQGRMFGLEVRPQPAVDHFYEVGTPIAFGRQIVHIHHTPGHCPGGVCLAVGGAGSPLVDLFVGDTLFAGSIGRTDLPGGDYPTLITSIRTVLFSYPDPTPVHPGHGPDTTIGTERRTNPFLVPSPIAATDRPPTG